MARANEKLLNVGVLLSDGAGFLMGGTLLLALNYAVMRPAGRAFILVVGQPAKERQVKAGKRLRGKP